MTLTKLAPIGKFKFVVDAYLADFRGRATLPMLGGFMLQAATKHAEERGFGYNSMKGMNRAWVLSRMAIEIYEYPKNEAVFEIHTWVADVNKLFTERYFAFFDESGKNFGYAKSIWASIDLETRRPTNVLELEGLSDFITQDVYCPIDGLKKILPIKDESAIGDFDVRYSDIDINKHLNSMKYIEHFVDVFGLEDYEESEICRFEINYIAEAHYGDQLELVKKQEEQKVSSIEMRKEDRVVSSARVTWK